jgi:hypothetical protein
MLDERTDAAFVRFHLIGPPSKSSVHATIFCGSKPHSVVTKNFSSALSYRRAPSSWASAAGVTASAAVQLGMSWSIP